MATAQISVTETLITRQCPVCGIYYAIPQYLWDKRAEDGGCWYCPNGHTLIRTETAGAKLATAQEELRKAQNRLANAHATNDQLAEDLSHTRRALATTRGKVTRLQKRAANGVCPCCNRSFVQLARHMQNKHPEFGQGDDNA